jgi:hypothetical protein
MGISTISRDWGDNVAIVRISTSDNISTVSASGYITAQLANILIANNGPFQWLPSDMTLVYCSNGWLFASISADYTSLTPLAFVNNVSTPVTVGHIAVYSTTGGQLSEDAAPAINAGNIQAGISGTAGAFVSEPPTAGNGTLILAAANAGGAFNTTISNGTMAQSTVYSTGDIGASTGGIVVATSLLRMKAVFAATAAGGSASQTFTDAFCTTSSIVSGDWVTQANAASVLTIVPGAGSFVVTSTANAGAGTFSYFIIK